MLDRHDREHSRPALFSSLCRVKRVNLEGEHIFMEGHYGTVYWSLTISSAGHEI